MAAFDCGEQRNVSVIDVLPACATAAEYNESDITGGRGRPSESAPDGRTLSAVTSKLHVTSL